MGIWYRTFSVENTLPQNLSKSGKGPVGFFLIESFYLFKAGNLNMNQNLTFKVTFAVLSTIFQTDN